jgi:hypothetical protein
MGLIELNRRLKLLKGSMMVEIAEQILKEDAPILLRLQKDQFLSGQKQDGTIPSYYQDTYFKSPIKAAKYARFKDKLIFNKTYDIFGTKEYETPNLIVKGNLVHDRLIIQIESGKIIIDVNSPIRGKLLAKYNNLFGLNKTALNYYLNTFFIIDYRHKIENFLAQ